MAYTPTIWKTGDVITAEKLNKAEQGIASASDEVFAIKATYALDGFSATLDKTLSEITSAGEAQKPFVMNAGFMFIQPDYESNEPVGVSIGQLSITGENVFNVEVMHFTDVGGVLTWTAPI